MVRGRLGGPRPFAECEMVMKASISTGALHQLEEGKRRVNERDVAEMEAALRSNVIKSFASGPSQQRIDVQKVAKQTVKIFLGDSITGRQIKDIERVMEDTGYKIATYKIQGD